MINESLGGARLDPVEKAAIDATVEAGVVMVASASNEGNAGMGFPGAGGWREAYLFPLLYGNISEIIEAWS